MKQHKAKEVIVKVAYAIGIAEPVMVTAIEDGKEIDINDELAKKAMTPASIIHNLDLRKPQFEKTAEWGHFGNNFLWDK